LVSDVLDCLTIGRSGTGKTTCSILRLLATEILYKIMVMKNQKILLTSENIEEAIGLRSVFITVSPNLSHDVASFYSKLVKKLKSRLSEKESKTKKGLLMDIDDEDQISDNEVKEVFSEVSLELDLLDNDYDFEQMNETNNKPKTNFIAYKDNQFPLFTTIKEFLYLIDSTLFAPYFYRDYNNEMIIEDTCEYGEKNVKTYINGCNMGASKGTMLFDKRHGSNLHQAEDEKFEDHLQYNDDTWGLLKQKSVQQKKEKNNEKASTRIDAKEITFEVFKNEFYPDLMAIAKNNLKNEAFLSPTLLWSEFMCEISGAPESHMYQGSTLSFDAYRTRVKERPRFVKPNMVSIIYDLHRKY